MPKGVNNNSFAPYPSTMPNGQNMFKARRGYFLIGVPQLQSNFPFAQPIKTEYFVILIDCAPDKNLKQVRVAAFQKRQKVNS